MDKNKKIKRKLIKIPLYFGDIIMYQVNDLELISKKYNTESLHRFDACNFRNEHKNGYLEYILAFNYNVNAMGIAHESLHLVDKIFNDRYMLYDIENDEFQCYLIGWIVNKCHKFLKIK